MMGYIVGKFIAALFLSSVDKNKRLGYLFLVLLLANIPLIFFGFVPTATQVIMIFWSAIPSTYIWGFIVFYVEGRRSTELIVMIIYMLLIMASGISKTLATSMMNAGVSENWMPYYCGLVGLVGCIIFTLLLNLAPPPTEEEMKQRRTRNVCTREQQWVFFKEFYVGLLCLFITYGMIASTRNYRDSYALELWNELIGADFDSSTYSITEIIVSICTTAAYCGIIFIKKEKTAFMTLILVMCFGGFFVGLVTLIYSLSEYNPKVWITLSGIGLTIAYVPPGAMLYDKLMGAVQIDMTMVFIIYVSEVFNSTTSLLVILIKTLVFSDMTHVQYFINLSYATFGISIICTTIAFFVFRNKINNIVNIIRLGRNTIAV